MAVVRPENGRVMGEPIVPNPPGGSNGVVAFLPDEAGAVAESTDR
ncbi:MAG TPA: hypothetical protein VGJ05_20850 [Fimbriiglobus sp.]|jgi:hypothetical protein